MYHQIFCKQELDIYDKWWHTAICESRMDNSRYAIEKGVQATVTTVDYMDKRFDATANVVNYSRAIVLLLFPNQKKL